jgi:signal transduction histidine kinase/ActR/RegA family two-component response regulator
MINFLNLQSIQKKKETVISISQTQKNNVNQLSNVSFVIALLVFAVNNQVLGNWNAVSAIGGMSFIGGWILLKFYTNKISVEVGKILLLILTYGFIFFTDLILGSATGIYFYYFSFILSLRLIFKWENEKFDTILFVLVLPLVLIIMVHLVRPFLLTDLQIRTFNNKSLFVFNTCLSFIIIATNTIFNILFHSKLEEKNLEIELNMNTLLDSTNANIRTINTNYEICSYNKAFKDTIQRHYQLNITAGFNMKYELFANPDFPAVLKESYVRALCGERVNIEYFANNEYFELMAAPLESEGDIRGAILYDRNITEKKLKDFESRQFVLDLKTLIDNTQGAIWSVNIKFEVITANESFIEMIRKMFNIEIYVGYCMLDLFQNSFFPESFQTHNITVMEGNTLNTHYEFMGNYFEINGRPLLNDNKEIIGATFHNVNITERKRNEMQVEQLSLNLQSLIDNTSNSIWSIDNNYRLITANKVFIDSFKKYFGVDLIIGFNITNLFKHPAFPAVLKTAYQSVLDGKHIQEVYAYNEMMLELNGKPIIKNGEIIGAAFYNSDVTETFRNSEKIKQSAINLQTIINNNTGNVWGIDTNHHILACNESFTTEIKSTFDLHVQPGFDLHQLFVKTNYPPELVEFQNKVLSGENVITVFETGDQFFELKGVPIMVDNQINGAAFFSEDITLKKQHEKELINAKVKAEDASKAKARFLSNMSHELRTPLNGVIGITNILCDEKKLASQQKHLDILKYSSDHMFSLINDILDFSKIDEGKVVLENTTFELQSTIDKTVETFSAEAKRKGLDFVVETKDIGDLSLIGDITRLRQIINNLITNAIKFTEKGKIDFKIRRINGLTDKKATIEFKILDTGIGIPKDKLERIFESFTQADVDTTRKYGGTGLGLTISKRLVDIMGGNLQVQSSLNAGTCFRFEMTFVTVSKLEARDQSMDIRNFGNIRILLAEDNKINMIVARKQLEKWGILVEEAENGLVAFNKFKANHYDLILMDMEMPIMDGLASTKMIRNINPDIPILALTAASFENMHEFLKEKGLNDFVSKPFSPHDLNTKIYNNVLKAEKKVAVNM